MSKTFKKMPSYFFTIISVFLLVIVTLTVTPRAVYANGLIFYPITESDANNLNIDAATDGEGKPHAVYERAGNIYYKAGTGNEELIAAGSSPAIAMGTDGKPQVVFVSGGNVLYSIRDDGDWQSPVTISSGDSADIDVDANNNAHVVYRCDFLGDGYVDIVYNHNIGGSFSSATLIWDGYYFYFGGGSSVADYYNFGAPSIKIDGSGAYHIISGHHHIDRASGWTDHSYYVSYKTSAGGGVESGSPYRGNVGIDLSRNALVLSGDGNAFIMYTQNGVTYLASPLPSWNEISLGLLSQPSMASSGLTINLAYINGTDVMYTVGNGEGFSPPQIIDTGSSPAVAAGNTFVYYLKSDGVNDEVCLKTDVLLESAPSVTLHPSDLTVTYGQEAVFSARAEGSPSPAVQWQVSSDGGLNYVDIDGQVESDLILDLPPVSWSGLKFRAVFTSSLGEATTDAATLTVSPASVTPEITISGRVYDGGIEATISSRGLTGVVADDDVYLAGGTAVFLNADVGNDVPVVVTGLSLAGEDADNYLLSSTEANTTADILPAPLTPLVTIEDKVYDGDNSAVISSLEVEGTIGDDDVILTGGTALFADRNAGEDKAVTITDLVLEGADSRNYVLSPTVASATADILPAPITVIAVTDSKIYDGTADSTGEPVLVGVLASGDTPVFTQRFESSDAGTGKLLIPEGRVNDGNLGENYSLTCVNSTGSILPRPLGIAAATGQYKIYGEPEPELVYDIVTGSLVRGDVITGSLSRSPGEDVGNYTINLGDLTAGSNYTLDFTGTEFTIYPRQITVSPSASSKNYDGTDVSSESPVIISGSLVDGDTADFRQYFIDKNAGTGKTLLATGTVQDGNGGANYQVTFVSSSLGTIEPAPVTPVITVASKTYDGTTSATISSRSLETVFGEDDVSLTGGTASFLDAGAGNGKPVTVTGLELAGMDKDNYTLTATSITVNADIYRAEAAVELYSLNQTFDGNPKTVTAATLPEGLTVNLTYDGSITPPIEAGSYTVVGTIMDSNYQGSATATLVISKADQTISFGPLDNRTYGDADFTIEASATSGLDIFFTAHGNCTVENSTVHITGAGECTITAHQSGNRNYNAAPEVQQQFTVAPAAATIEVTGWDHVYDGTPKLVSVTTQPAGVNYEVIYLKEMTVINSPVDAGSYSVEVNIHDANYTGDGISGTLTIARAIPMINWPDPGDITWGTPLSEIQLNAACQVPGSFTYNPAEGRVLDPGQYQALNVVFSPADSNYEDASKTVYINVNRAVPVINLVSSPNPSLPGKEISFKATVSSSAGIPTGEVTFKDGETVLGSVTLISGEAVFTTSTLSTSSHSITAIYGGDNYFAGASSAVLNQRVTVPSSPGGGGGEFPSIIYLKGFGTNSTVILSPADITGADHRLQSADGGVILNVTRGTRLTGATGSPLTELTLGNPDIPPQPPSGTAIILCCSFAPSGASFNPPLTLSLKYNPEHLPAGTAEKDLYIAWFDGADWQALETTVNLQDRTATARVSHFSLYALLAKVVPAVERPSPEASPRVSPAPPAPPPSVTPAPPPSSPSPEPTLIPGTPLPSSPGAAPQESEQNRPEVISWIIGIIATIVVLGLMALVLLRKKTLS